MRPLHSLCNTTKGKTKLLWTEHCNNAFETLKTKLSTTPVLGYPDFNEEFFLEIDASFNRLGAVLSQRQDGKTVVVAYASRGLRKHERNMNNYNSMKLELLALYLAVTVKFRDILIGSQFVVFTDNNPLSFVNSSAKIGATEMRWVADLALFNLTMQYRSGRSNKNADALSRKTDHGPEEMTHRFVEVEESCLFLEANIMVLVCQPG